MAKRIQNFLIWICLAVIMLLFISIVVRAAAEAVLDMQPESSSSFLRLLAGESEDTKTDSTLTHLTIDWAALYPFQDQGTQTPDGTADQVVTEVPGQETGLYAETLAPLIRTYGDFVWISKSTLEDRCTDELLCYRQLVSGLAFLEKSAGWNLAPIGEYNNLYKTDDSYFIGVDYPLKSEVMADAVAEFRDRCGDNGAEFVYVMCPSKVCVYEDAGITGTFDYSNPNADALLEAFKSRGVDYIDLRASLHDDGLGHHAAFYNTDHHWRAETGLWAAGKLLEYLGEEYDVDASVLNPDNFTYEVYPEWFLGSQGRKATLVNAVPDDFTMIYPVAETKFHYVIPSLDIDETGDFSITYYYEAVKTKNYYKANPYSAYNHGDEAIIEINNELVDNGLSVLMIKHSYANVVIPFMAMGIEKLTALDLRCFTGSLEKYIAATKPDVVMILYSPTCIAEEIDYTDFTSIYNFK